MMITRNNLNDISHTQATLYYYHDNEITVEKALEIYNRAMMAEEDDAFSGVSYLAFSREKNKLVYTGSTC